MRLLTIFGGAMALLSLISGAVQAQINPNLALESMRWVTIEKVRAGYLWEHDSPDTAYKMANAGMNAALVQFNNYRGGDITSLTRIQQWATTSGKAKIRLFVGFSYAGETETQRIGPYVREVDRYGNTLSNTPSPVDKRYWNDIVATRAIEIARLSRKVPISGIMIDLEMYGADHMNYNLPSFDDLAWAQFLANRADRARMISLPASQRYDWLMKNNLMDAYTKKQMETVWQILELIERKVHAENPYLILGAALADHDIWFMKAVRFGLGTPRMPMLCWAESTYILGYSKYIEQTIKRIDDEGSNALVVGGLWLRQFYSGNVAEHSFYLARSGAGYWTYNVEVLLVDPSQVPFTGRLADPPPAYWDALAFANSEIKRCLQNGADLPTSLVIQPASSPPYPTMELNPSTLGLRPLSDQPLPLPLSGSETQLTGSNVLLFYASMGEPIRFDIQAFQFAAYRNPTSYALLDPAGQHLKDGWVPYGQTATVTHAAPTSGIYALSVNSVENGCRVTSYNHSVGYLASPDSPLYLLSYARPLYFVAPPNLDKVALTLTTGWGEGVRARLIAPDGAVRWNGIASSQTRLEAPAGPPGVWTLEITHEPGQVFEGMQVALLPPLTPTLSDAPPRVLGPA